MPERVPAAVTDPGGLAERARPIRRRQASRTFQPGAVADHAPTGLLSLIPLGDTFRYYSVTGSVREETADNYRLSVSGLVDRPAPYSLADLKALPQTSLVQDFQCVTGWHVPAVHWAGVRLSDLLEQAGPARQAGGARVTAFCGTS